MTRRSFFGSLAALVASVPFLKRFVRPEPKQADEDDGNMVVYRHYPYHVTYRIDPRHFKNGWITADEIRRNAQWIAESYHS